MKTKVIFVLCFLAFSAITVSASMAMLWTNNQIPVNAGGMYNTRSNGSTSSTTQNIMFNFTYPRKIAVHSEYVYRIIFENSSSITGASCPRQVGTFANNILVCSLDVVGNTMELSGAQVITVSATSVKNFHVSASIELWTDAEDGILLYSDNSVGSWAQYNGYETLQAQSYVYINNHSVTSNGCGTTTPCTTVFYDTSSVITLDIVVNKFFIHEETNICLSFNGGLSASLGDLSVESLPNVDTGLLPLAEGETQPSIDKVLVATKLAGTLKLKKQSTSSTYCLEGIAQFIDETSTYANVKNSYQFVPDRKFKLRLSSFLANYNIGTKLFDNVTLYVEWRNVASRLSHFTYSSTTNLAIKDRQFVSSNFVNYETLSFTNWADRNLLYLKGSYPIRITLKIPKADKGILTLETVKSDDIEINFFTSTCDFSAGSTFSNTYGTRPVCYNKNSNEINKLNIKFGDKITAETEYVFNVWVSVNKCKENSATDFTRSIKFNLTYTNLDGEELVTSKDVTADIKCSYAEDLNKGLINSNDNSVNSFKDGELTTTYNKPLFFESSSYQFTNPTITVADNINSEDSITKYSDIISANTTINNNDLVGIWQGGLNDSLGNKQRFGIRNRISRSTNSVTNADTSDHSVISTGKYYLGLPDLIFAKKSSATNATTCKSFVLDSDPMANANPQLSSDVFTSTIANIVGNLVEVSVAAEDNSLESNDTDLSIGIGSSCFTYRPTYEVKNIYENVAIYLYFSSETSTLRNRILRFNKLYNNSRHSSFNLSQKSIPDVPDALWDNVFFHSPSAIGEICLLELKLKALNVLNQGASANSVSNVLLTFLKTGSLISSGSYSPADVYPTSKAASGVSFYANWENNNYESNDLQFGQTLNIVKGLSLSANTTPTSIESSILIPLNCGYASNHFTAQSYKQNSSSSSIDRANTYQFVKIGDTIIDLNIGHTDNRDQHTGIKTSYDLTFNNDSSSNTITLATTGQVPSYSAVLLLAKSQTNDGVETKTLFGNNYTTGHVQGLSFNGSTWDLAYYAVARDNTFSGDVVTNLLKRSVSTSVATNNIKLHGYRETACTPSISCGNKVNKIYFTNGDVTVPPQPVVAVSPSTLVINDITFSLADKEVNYLLDDGQNSRFTVTLTATEADTGSITVSVSGRISSDNTHVYYKTSRCTSSSGEFTCFGLSVTSGSNSFSFLVYNFSNGNLSTSNVKFQAIAKWSGSKYTAEKTVNDLNNIDAVALPVPSVDRICTYQTNQEDGYGVVEFVVDAKRSHRLNQSVSIVGGFKSIFGDNASLLAGAHCTAMISNASSCSNKDFDDEPVTSPFINSCDISAASVADNAFTVTLRTNNWIPSLQLGTHENHLEWGRYYVIRFSPVWIKNLSAQKQNVVTQLQSVNRNTISATLAEADRVLYPVNRPGKSSWFGAPTTEKTGLCDLTRVGLPFAGSWTEVEFTFNTAGVDAALSTINSVTGATVKKSINEVTVYLDPQEWNINTHLWCYWNQDKYAVTVPCEWNKYGFINVRVPVTDSASHKLKITGVKLPNLVGKWNHTCSLNFFSNDVRENIWIGTGVNAITVNMAESLIETVNAGTNGNFLYYNAALMLSNTTPNEKTDLYLRFTQDFTNDLTNIRQFTHADGSNVVVYVKLNPMYFNLVGATVTATLSLTKVYKPADVTQKILSNPNFKHVLQTERVTKNLTITETNTYYGYVRLRLADFFDSDETETPSVTDLSFRVPYDTLFFDLKLGDVPTPSMKTTTDFVEVFFVNDPSNPTSVVRSYPNLNNFTGNEIAGQWRRYEKGFSFDWKANRGYLQYNSSIDINPGRYKAHSFNLVTNNSIISTSVSAPAGQVVVTYEDKLDLNSLTALSGSLRLGTNCDTLYGSYWLSLTATGDNLHNLSNIRVNVLERNSRASIFVSNTFNASAARTTLDILQNGLAYVYFTVNEWPVNKITIDVKNPAAKEGIPFTFYGTEQYNPSIDAKNWSSYTIYKMEELDSKITTGTDQLVTFNNKDNKCFGFASSTSVDSVDVKFVIGAKVEQLPTTYKFEDSFLLVARGTNEEDIINFTFDTPPDFGVYGVFVLACRDADAPTFEQVKKSLDTKSYKSDNLYNIQQQWYPKEATSVNVKFSGLFRGANSTKYRLHAFIYVDSVKQEDGKTFKYVAKNGLKLKAADTTEVEFETPRLPDTIIHSLTFDKQLTDDNIIRLTNGVQGKLGSDFRVVFRLDGNKQVSATGYTDPAQRTCSADGLVKSLNLPTPQPVTPPKTLRLLQDTPVVVTTAEVPVTTQTNSSYTYYFTVRQVSGNSTADLKVLVTDAIDVKYVESAIGIAPLSAGRYIDTNFDEITFDSVKYNEKTDKATNSVEVTYKSSTDLNCSFVVNTGTPLLTDASYTCVAGNALCGTLKISKTTDTPNPWTQTIGALGVGKYNIQIYCQSSFNPQNAKYVSILLKEIKAEPVCDAKCESDKEAKTCTDKSGNGKVYVFNPSPAMGQERCSLLFSKLITASFLLLLALLFLF